MAVQISGNDITVPRDTTVTRNLTVGGVLTYEDVTNVDSVGLVTARTGIEIGARPGVAASISVDGNMIVSGVTTFTPGGSEIVRINSGGLLVYNDVSFFGASTHAYWDHSASSFALSDNTKLKIGSSGSDLQIYHDGTNTQIDNNTGDLIIRGDADDVKILAEDDILLRDNDDSTNFIHCINGGAVELYHNGTKTFETVSGGAKVTGELDVFETSGDILHVQGNSTDSTVAKIENAYTSDNDRFAVLEIKSGKGQVRFNSNSDSIEGAITYEMANNAMIFGVNNAAERMRIDSAGRLQHGHSSSIVGGKIEVHAATAETQITINESSDSGTGPALYINRTRGSDLSSPSPVEDNNYIGSIHFGSYDTSSYEKGASIICVADGQTWANGDCPARLSFLTTPDNSQTPTEKMRILPDGVIMTNGLDGDTDITTTGTGDTYDGMALGKPPLRVTRTSGCPLFLNRNGSGGYIQEWRYGGSIVGYVSNTGNSLPSDRNYKKNITNLSLGLDLVNKLQPISYHYKFDADSDPVMYGLIAQDVETALNDAGVAQNTAAILQYEEKNDEKDSDYALDYIKLTPILINAVKELSAEIESLKSEIAALKSS